MSMIEALLEERRGYIVRGNKARVAQVDAEIARLGGVRVADDLPEVETADGTPDAEVETAAFKRGPGRPRKAD